MIGLTHTAVERLQRWTASLPWAAPSAERIGAYLRDNIQLVLACSMWYLTSSLSGIFAKQLLSYFPRVLSVTYFAFVLNVLFGVGIGRLGPSMHVDFPPSNEALRTLLPFSVLRVFSHVTSTMSLSRISLSLMHTIKAVGPLFTVILTYVLFEQRTSAPVLLTLFPVSVGVMLSCYGDYHFDLVGALLSVVSVAMLAMLSIQAKQLFLSKNVTEYALMCHSSYICAIILTPPFVFYELPQLFAMPELPISVEGVIVLLIVAGLTQYAQGAFSYTTVKLASPITHSVASVTKRIVMISLSVVWFQTPLSLMNTAGVLLTFAGMLAYNMMVMREKMEGKSPKSPLSSVAIGHLPVVNGGGGNSEEDLI